MFTARLDDAIDSSIVIVIVMDYYFSDIKGTLCYRDHQMRWYNAIVMGNSRFEATVISSDYG